MKDLILALLFFIIVGFGIGLTEWVVEHYVTELGIVVGALTVYGFYRAFKFAWKMK